MLTEQETLLGRGSQTESGRVEGTQEDCSAPWLEGSGLLMTGLVSGLSLTNRSDSGSFLAVHALLSQDGFQREGF